MRTTFTCGKRAAGLFEEFQASQVAHAVARGHEQVREHEEGHALFDEARADREVFGEAGHGKDLREVFGETQAEHAFEDALVGGQHHGDLVPGAVHVDGSGSGGHGGSRGWGRCGLGGREGGLSRGRGRRRWRGHDLSENLLGQLRGRLRRRCRGPRRWLYGAGGWGRETGFRQGLGEQILGRDGLFQGAEREGAGEVRLVVLLVQAESEFAPVAPRQVFQSSGQFQPAGLFDEGAAQDARLDHPVQGLEGPIVHLGERFRDLPRFHQALDLEEPKEGQLVVFAHDVRHVARGEMDECRAHARRGQVQNARAAGDVDDLKNVQEGEVLQATHKAHGLTPGRTPSPEGL